MGPFKEFPFVMHHISGDKIVHSAEERDQAIEAGYSTEPLLMSEEGRIKAKVKWHEDAIKSLKRELAEHTAKKAA
jgi:hypothetical protein